jgi:hypothetical protein
MLQLLQVAQALEYLHIQQVVHGDLRGVSIIYLTMQKCINKLCHNREISLLTTVGMSVLLILDWLVLLMQQHTHQQPEMVQPDGWHQNFMVLNYSHCLPFNEHLPVMFMLLLVSV